MTYIDLINRFWKIHRIECFSTSEIALYFHLLDECNLRGWPNKFEYPNSRIVLAIGIAEKTVIACRCRLQQKGVLEFEAGKRRSQSPIYYLPEVSKEVSKEVSLNIKTKTKDLEEKRTTNVVPKNSVAAKAATLEQRTKVFYDSLVPFVEVYGKEMIRAFYNYWTEPNKSKTKMRFELEKTWDVSRRLVTWANRESIKVRNNGHQDRYEQKRIDSEQRKAESLANLDNIRAAAERRRKELEAEGII